MFDLSFARAIRVAGAGTALALSSLVLGGCGTAKNVVFENRNPGTGPAIVSIFYDRVGDLYPSAAAFSAAEFISDPTSPDERITLRDYYLRKRGDSAWTRVLAETRVADPGGAFAPVWLRVQDSLRARVIRDLRLRTTAAAEPATLFLTVHGFNNDMGEAKTWYALVHDTVSRRLTSAGRQPPVFLDIYWDGLTASAPPGIWEAAQYNFPLVGLELRRVLNALDPRVPLRVFTHSSGGPLIASTLGDASNPFRRYRNSNDRNRRHYFSHVRDTTGAYAPPPSRDLRVAMIVPAAASNTFTDFGRASSRLDRLIIGINQHDFAIAKGPFGCRILGATCMSAEPIDFCRDVPRVFAGDPRTKLYLFDFTSWPIHTRQVGLWANHGIAAYLERDDMRNLLHLLLDPSDQPVVADELESVCHRSR